MNEQLQSKLVEILSSIQAAAKAGGDFAMEQLPEIAQTYVAYGRAQSAIDLALALAMLIGGLFILRAVAANVKEHGDFWDAEPLVTVPGGIAGGGLMLLGAISLKAAAGSAALVWMAPKVWLLRELAGLLK